MSTEWKPGDVGLIPFARGDVRGMFTTDGWVCSDMHYPAVRGYSDIRPLVVIDPEDREQVARLVRHPDFLGDLAADIDVDALQAALREFANPKPPKPEEPTGLGAVVEDEDGEQYIRTNPSGANPWVPVDAGARGFTLPYRDYRHIAAVRVLSKGVQP